MNTITTTASTSVSILGIDLGKYKSVACLHDHASGEVRFTTVETTGAELRKLLDKERPAAVVIEACLLAGWVHDLCLELGVRCLVANTASEAWKFKHLKRKTDKDDASDHPRPRFRHSDGTAGKRGSGCLCDAPCRRGL